MAWWDPTANLTFAPLDIPPAAKLNKIRDDLLFLYQSTVGSGSYIGGTPPSGGIYAQVATAVPTTTSGGGFNMSLPHAFGTGLVLAHLTTGDTFSGTNPWFVTPIVANCTLSAIGGIAHDKTGAVINALAIRVNCTAWGWD